MDLSPSSTALRLCACRFGEVVDGLTAPTPRDPHTVVLGTVVEARWDPLHHSQLGILYSSGTLRLWDVLVNSYRDYALYFPVSGLPSAPTGSHDIEDRRSAAPISHFDFVSVPSGTSVSIAADGLKSRVVLSVKRSKRLYIVDVPAAPATVAQHYLSGSILYDCKPDLPAEASVVRSFLVASSPVPFACVAVGCSDGSLCVWGVSGTLNPVRPAPSLRDEASPRVIRISTFHGAAAPSGTGAGYTPPASGTGATLSAAHTGRVRSITQLPLTQGGIPYSVTTGAAAAATSGDTSYTAANNVFVTSGSDGRVRLWAVTACEPDGAGAGGPELSVTVAPLADLPCDGVPVTALTAAAWPWHLTDTHAQRATLSAYGYASGGAVPAAAPQRSILVTATAEGVLTVWQLLIPAHLRNMTATPLKRTSGGAPVSSLLPATGVESHLCGLSAVEGNEPVLDLAISPSATAASEPYKLAVAAAGGQLAVYTLQGSAAAASVGEEAAYGCAGAAVPLTLVLSGHAGQEGPALSSYDVIRASMGPQAMTLAQLAAEGGGEAGVNMAATITAAAVSGTAAPLTSALTHAALQQLQRTFVTCCFNEAARTASGLSGGNAATAALAACAGGGDILLFTRNGLPGDPEPLSAAEQEEAEAEALQQAQQELEEQRRRELEAQQAAAAAAAAEAGQEEEEATEEEQQEQAKEAAAARPPAISIRRGEGAAGGAGGVASGEEDDQDDEDEEEDEEEARAGPPAPVPASATAAATRRVQVPHVLSQTASSAAKAAAAAALAAAAAEHQAAEHRLRSQSRSRSRSKSYLRIAAMDAVRSAYSERTISGSHAARSADRSVVGPVERAHARQRAPAALPGATGRAIPPLCARSVTGSVSDGASLGSRSASNSRSRSRGGDRDRDRVGEHDQSWSGLKGFLAGGREAGGGHGGLDATRTGASSVSASFAAGTRTADVTAADITGTRPPGGSPAAEAGTGGSSPLEALRARLRSKASGPYLDSRFRSPAKVAALVVRDAALNVRAGALAAKAAAATPDAAADDHPTAAASFAAGRLVAPSLGSSAAIALEIRKLESSQFDERAALRDILRARKVDDAVITTTLLQRVAEREQAAAAAKAAGGSGSTGEPVAPSAETAASSGPFAYEPGVFRPADVFTVPAYASLYDTSILPPVTDDYPLERARSRSRSKSLGPGAGVIIAAAVEGTRPVGDSPQRAPASPPSLLQLKAAQPVTVSAADIMSWRGQLRSAAPVSTTSSARTATKPRAPATAGAAPAVAAVAPPALSAAAPAAAAPTRGRPYYRAGDGVPLVQTINYNPVMRSSRPGEGR